MLQYKQLLPTSWTMKKEAEKILQNADSHLIPEDMSLVSSVVRICNVRNTLICFASLVNNADFAVNFNPINSFP